MKANNAISGLPILLVQGGPGFSHDYLSEPLAPLAATHPFVWIDDGREGGAPRAPNAFDASVAACADAICNTAREGPISVVAHSWGCLVLLAAMNLPERAESLSRQIAGGVLINPAPLDRRSLDRVAAEVRGRTPWMTRLAFLYDLCIARDTDAAMTRLLPSYGGSDAVRGEVHLGLDIKSYARVMKDAGDYRIAPPASVLSHFTLLRSERDITPVAFVESIAANVKRVVTLPDTGHFPMFDKPGEFAAAVEAAL
jgi:pimeloyl-ACP methyl ester carboxylesterase